MDWITQSWWSLYFNITDEILIEILDKSYIKNTIKVESNRTNFELIFIKFFELFFTFRINRIINFQIQSNKFRTNPAFEKFDSTLYVVGVELNRTNFKLIFIEFFKYYLPFRINESQILESNQTNFKWILTGLHP